MPIATSNGVARNHFKTQTQKMQPQKTINAEVGAGDISKYQHIQKELGQKAKDKITKQIFGGVKMTPDHEALLRQLT